MLYALLFFAILIADQFSKTVVDAFNIQNKVVIPKILNFHNERNDGAAFSLFGGYGWAKWFFIILTVIVLAAMAFYIITSKSNSKLKFISLTMIMGGAVGNLIDRIALGEVRDFILPTFFNFANFNVADIFVCVGAVLFAIYILFFDEEAIFGKRKNKKE